MRFGKLLLKERKNRGFQKYLAQSLGVTTQTLRNWRRRAERESYCKLGRPRYTEAQREEAHRLVAREMKMQMYPGWRPIAKALPWLPTRLVQEYVKAFKKRQRKKTADRIEEQRTGVEVLAREAIWTVDGTQRKDELGADEHSQVVKDRGTLAYRAVESGRPATASEFQRVLELCGIDPLVIATDRARIFCGKESAAWMAARKIIHLKSLPRTPQHNGAIEIGIRILKEAAESSGVSLRRAAKQINIYRLHGSKEYKTSTVLDAELPVAYHKVSREEFYEKCSKRLSRIQQSPMVWRAKQMLEREVIYATLEEYGLIKRTGGEGSRWRAEAKNFL